MGKPYMFVQWLKSTVLVVFAERRIFLITRYFLFLVLTMFLLLDYCCSTSVTHWHGCGLKSNTIHISKLTTFGLTVMNIIGDRLFIGRHRRRCRFYRSRGQLVVQSINVTDSFFDDFDFGQVLAFSQCRH